MELLESKKCKPWILDKEKEAIYEVCLNRGSGCLAQHGLRHFLEMPISVSFLKAYIPGLD